MPTNGRSARRKKICSSVERRSNFAAQMARRKKFVVDKTTAVLQSHSGEKIFGAEILLQA
jgi:hypothetical protein